jgi:general secretion pathway protein G
MLLQGAGLLALLFGMHSCLNQPFARPLPQGRAYTATARTQLASLAMALETYRLDVGSLPTCTQGLDALIRVPEEIKNSKRWKGPYLADATSVPLDPWDHAYVYAGRADGKACSVTSYGADGRPGGERDDADIRVSLPR